MLISTVDDFRRAVQHGPYTFPGCYPVYWVMADGEACRFDVALSNESDMIAALEDRFWHSADPWRPVALEVNWEDENLVCAHTGLPIECAYPADTVECDVHVKA